MRRLVWITRLWLWVVLGCTNIDERQPGVIEPSGGAETPLAGREANASTEGLEGVEAPPRPAQGAAFAADVASIHFGELLVGAQVTREIVVRNTGDAPLSLRSQIDGPDALAFAIVQGCAPLAPGARCSLPVRFTASVLGSYEAALELVSDASMSLRLPLSASVMAPGSLSVNASAQEFGLVEAAAGQTDFVWTITNDGATASAALALTASPVAPFSVVQNACVGVLASGASCSVTIRFAPATAGPFAGSIQVGDGTMRVSLALTGRGGHRLTVIQVGTGQVSSPSPALTCDAGTCTGLFAPGAVQVEARTQNGSNSFFSGWSVGNCGAQQTCLLQLETSLEVTATFSQLQSNLIFASSTLHPATRGGLAPYDAECNRLASAAGINDADGQAFVAAMSDSTSSLRERLGGARGWVRLDGLPFADTLASLFDDDVIYYPAAFDELGRKVPAGDEAYNSGGGLSPNTGTLADGSASPDNCGDWSSDGAGLLGTFAQIAAGPGRWIEFLSGDCSLAGLQRLVCMGRSRSAAITRPSSIGKRMWTVFDYSPGSMTPDQRCQMERPVGVTNAAAFVAYRDRPAAAVLSSEASYVRPDGALVGSGADIARFEVLTAPWLRADGTFNPVNEAVWSGAYAPDVVSEPDFDCNEWQSGSDTTSGYVGTYGAGDRRWFFTLATTACSFARAMYCVEL
jgi:hypothetical protein